MALTVGTQDADRGLSKAVYDQLDALLSPPLQQAVEAASGPAKEAAQQALEGARSGWRKLAFAIATGVVTHLLDNLEVTGVRTGGNVVAQVSGQVAVQNGVVLAQVNGGTGLVR
ncbi:MULTISPECIES: hypothetical protein [unclassified Geodermatophilus]|uniref:hypothetical protein n=1 Tax=unclassified Geodermatophilus TaxID=2637632 RepID=UPI003EECCD71